MNQTVLGWDRGAIYDAKILKVQELEGVRKYFIHFLKWARKYDIWIDESLLSDKDDIDGVARLESLGVRAPADGSGASTKKKSSSCSSSMSALYQDNNTNNSAEAGGEVDEVLDDADEGSCFNSSRYSVSLKRYPFVKGFGNVAVLLFLCPHDLARCCMVCRTMNSGMYTLIKQQRIEDVTISCYSEENPHVQFPPLLPHHLKASSSILLDSSFYLKTLQDKFGDNKPFFLFKMIIVYVSMLLFLLPVSQATYVNDSHAHHYCRNNSHVLGGEWVLHSSNISAVATATNSSSSVSSSKTFVCCGAVRDETKHPRPYDYEGMPPGVCSSTNTMPLYLDHGLSDKRSSQCGDDCCSCDRQGKTRFVPAPRELYQWKPATCQLMQWDADLFCELLGARTLLLVGDSTMQQSASTLMSMVINTYCIFTSVYKFSFLQTFFPLL